MIYKYIPKEYIEYLDKKDRSFLNDIFLYYQGFPNLNQLWTLMDKVWDEFKCDPLVFGENIKRFYEHPVWLLNGLYIEQDRISLHHRKEFTNWIKAKTPTRIADYGGGFGSLARLISRENPNIKIDIIEPHPHPLAIYLASKYENVNFIPVLKDNYDILISTDVFEHVPDPIDLVEKISLKIKKNGYFLIANCFQPVIKCHLKQLLHLDIGWDQIMIELGTEPKEVVSYGRAYQIVGKANKKSAKSLEKKIKIIYSCIKFLPKGKGKIGKFIVKILFKLNKFSKNIKIF